MLNNKKGYYFTVKTWNDYKEYVKKTDAITGKDLSEIEEQARIISAVIKQRTELSLSQRDLADICSTPQQSVTRIK